MEIKVSHVVKVIDKTEVYSSYEEWIKKYVPQYLNNFVKNSNNIVEDVSSYVVLFKEKHIDYSAMLCLIQNMQTKQVYIISESGIELARWKSKMDADGNLLAKEIYPDDMELRFEGIL